MFILRHGAVKPLVGLLILLLLIVYCRHRKAEFVVYSDCRWPLPRPAVVSADAPFDITICVQPLDSAVNQSEPSYPLSQLFDVPPETYPQRVTFDGMANLPDEIWKHSKYPEVFSTYPQNVPMRELVDEIKHGQRILHVSKGLL